MLKNGDFASGEDGDLLISDGDFVFDEADQEHIIDIFNASPGHWKEFPLLGVAIDSYRNSSGLTNDLERSARIQLESDNYKIDDLKASINGDDVQIYLTGGKNYAS